MSFTVTLVTSKEYNYNYLSNFIVKYKSTMKHLTFLEIGCLNIKLEVSLEFSINETRFRPNYSN